MGQYTAPGHNDHLGAAYVFEVPTNPLYPGEANQDLSFDQLDLVQVLQAAKYMTGETATWGVGDWNGAPGGEPGSPPKGDGMFDQLDVIGALGTGLCLAGPYAATTPRTLPAAVFEPSTIVLLLIGFASLVRLHKWLRR